MTNLELQWLYFKVCAHLVNCSVADSSNPQMIIIKILSILPSCGGTCGTLTLSLILSYFFKKVAHALNSQTTPTMTHMNEIFVVFQLDCTAFGRPACENIFNNITTLPLTHLFQFCLSVYISHFISWPQSFCPSHPRHEEVTVFCSLICFYPQSHTDNMITQRWLDNQVLLGYKSSKFVFICFPLMTVKHDSGSQRKLVRFYMYIYTKVQQNDRWIPLLWFYMTKKKKVIFANSKLTTFCFNVITEGTP